MEIRTFFIILLTIFFLPSSYSLNYELYVKKIAFQGVAGSYSFIASNEIFPNSQYISYETFAETIEAVSKGEADYAVIPIENSIGGRVEDVYKILKTTNMKIVQEYFLKIQHQLLGINSTDISEIKTVISHPQALAQCSEFIQNNHFTPIPRSNTAVACVEVLETQDKSLAAVGSRLAAKMYGLKILAENIQNTDDNETRFVVFAREISVPQYEFGKKYITSLLITIDIEEENLITIMYPFSINEVNIRKIDTYSLDVNTFRPTQFYLEVEAHPRERKFLEAMEGLKDRYKRLVILGSYLSEK